MERRFIPDPTLERLREAADYVEKIIENSDEPVMVELVCVGHQIIVRGIYCGPPRTIITENIRWEDILQGNENPIIPIMDRLYRKARRLLPTAPHVSDKTKRAPQTAAELFSK